MCFRCVHEVESSVSICKMLKGKEPTKQKVNFPSLQCGIYYFTKTNTQARGAVIRSFLFLAVCRHFQMGWLAAILWLGVQFFHHGWVKGWKVAAVRCKI